MVQLAWPTRRRLLVALSLLLAIAVAVPESSSGRHTKPKRANGTAFFAFSFSDPEAGRTPPVDFTCVWNDDLHVHDYQCTPSPTGWPQPAFRLEVALSRNQDEPERQPLPGQEWNGLANPAFAPSFRCLHDSTLAFGPQNYRCTFNNGQVHSFTADKIVAVCDNEGVTPAGLSFCSESYFPPHTPEGSPLVFTPVELYDPPRPDLIPPPRQPFEGPGEGFFELDSWYPPDTVPPDTSITGGPSAVHGPDTEFDFESLEDGSTFECRLDASGWEECAPPQEYAGLDGGGHTFEVRATDNAENLDVTPAAWFWHTDATAPDTAILRGPGDFTRDRTPRFVFTASEVTANFECAVDSGSFDPCPSPHTVRRRLGDGRHTLRVAAVDGVGNVDDSPASRSFTVDRTGPRVQIAAGRVRLNQRGAARMRLRCPAAELSGLCTGSLALKATPRLKVGSGRTIVTLAKTSFRLRRGQTGAVALKLFKNVRGPVMQRERLRIRATARARDRLKNVATTSRRLLLESAVR